MSKNEIYDSGKFSKQEDNIIRQLFQENRKRSKSQKIKWNEIAEHLRHQIPASKKTGKQCRERWHNQLDDSILHTKFTDQEIARVFALQDEKGNRWAAIANEMPGRTDNNVKNMFNSSLRRALRHLNHYLTRRKRRTKLKPFKEMIITKILAISDQKQSERLQIKNNEAINIAREIKNMLCKLSMMNQDEQIEGEAIQFREKLIKLLQNFNKCCKKRKQKKMSEESHEDEANDQQQQLVVSRQSSEKKSQRTRNSQKTQKSAANVIASKDPLVNSDGLILQPDNQKQRETRRSKPLTNMKKKSSQNSNANRESITNNINYPVNLKKKNSRKPSFWNSDFDLFGQYNDIQQLPFLRKQTTRKESMVEKQGSEFNHVRFWMRKDSGYEGLAMQSTNPGEKEHKMLRLDSSYGDPSCFKQEGRDRKDYS